MMRLIDRNEMSAALQDHWSGSGES